MLILSYSLRNMFKFLNSIKTPSALFILFSLILFPITSAFAQTTLSPTLLVRGLERGLYGEDVQELQKFLNVSGFVVSSDGPGSPGNETTFFGDLTLEALTRFQEANPDTYRSVGLDKPSGYFGPATMTKVVEVAETIPDVKIVPPSPQVFEKVVSYKPYVGREVEPENTIFEPFKKIAKTIIQSQLTVPVSTVTPISTLIPVNTPAPVITTTVTSTSGAGSNSSPSSSAPIVYAEDLTDISVSGSPSNFSFSGSTYTYNNITVINDVESITITPTGSGTITVDGVEVVSGEASGSIALTEGVEKTISIVVTETGKSLKTYTLNITRNSGVTVTPTFSPVAGAVTFGTTVTIASSGADAIYYTTDGSTPTTSSTNQAVTPLVINSAVTVKALAVKATYDDSSVASATYTQSETADLTGLALSGSPSNYTFVGSTYTYNSVALLNAVSSVTVTPTGSGTITVDGVEVVSGEASGSIALTEGVEKTITVVATETGKSAKTYTINVTRAVASPTGLTASAVSTSAIDISWTNTDETAQTRVYRGGSLVTTVNAAVTTYSDTGLSGGTEYTYTVRHYKNSVESVDSTSDSATTSLAVEYLVVAGGGGGRSGFIDGQPGGGGGAASLVTAATFQPGITYTIVVGAGGAGGASGSASGANGGESSLHNGTSYLARMAGGTGGSGTTGGAGGTVLSGSGAAGGVGGNQNTSPGSIGSGTGGGGGGGYGGTGGGNGGAGGGGGAGGVGGTSPGTAGVSSSGSGGQPGWDGANASGGGGGGGGYNISGKCNSTSGCYGGGGGGGGGASQGNPAGNGGEGVVIIRYLGSQKATGGTITSSGGYTIHTFTSSGTFSF